MHARLFWSIIFVCVSAGDILRDRDDVLSHLDNKDFDFSDEFAKEMTTPQDHSVYENVMDDEKLSKTPIVSTEIYKRYYHLDFILNLF
jgi:hypothetical protein